MRHIISEFNISWHQAQHLLTCAPHSPYLKRHRMSFLIGRVQLVSLVFAVLTPTWAILDYLAFPAPEWAILTAMRFASGLVFAILAWPWSLEATQRNAFVMLGLMLFAPLVFYLVSQPLLMDIELTTLGRIANHLYALLPFVILAGLAVFPLTMIEVLILGLPLLVVTAYGAGQFGSFEIATYIGSLWLAGLIFLVSLFASVSQLRYMITLVARSSQDPLTNVFTRRSGSEVMDIQFRVSSRQENPFSILFLDIDHFKTINDQYGHEVGDQTLVMFTENLRSKLRASDIIVRWGGEEFLVVLPNSTIAGTRLVIDRIMEEWLGERPDGEPLTASIGVAERIADQLEDWPELVELADERMYRAKQNGRARAVFDDDSTADDLAISEHAEPAIV